MSSAQDFLLARQMPPDLDGPVKRLFRHESEVHEQPVRPAVDMRRHGYAAERLHLPRRLAQRQIRRADEQRFFFVNHLVVAVHHILMSEEVRLIFLCGQPPANHLAEIERRFHIRRIPEQMHFFARGNFHRGQEQHFVCVARLFCRGQIARRVVIGHSDHVQSLQFCHATDIRRGHVVVPAGGETRMDMQVGKILHRGYPLSGTPAPCMRPQIS